MLFSSKYFGIFQISFIDLKFNSIMVGEYMYVYM